MSAPCRYDDATMDRAVRMYRERQEETGESELGARRRIGELLGINQATLRNWVELAEVDSGVKAGTTSSDNEELKRSRKGNAELARANEILRPPHQVIIDYIDAPRSFTHRSVSGARGLTLSEGLAHVTVRVNNVMPHNI